MADKSPHPYRLMTPGPVQVPQKILNVMAEPMLHHRTPQFARIFKKTLNDLKYIFQTEQPVLTLTATGSGAMEAALVNTLSPKDEILVIESGKFGERWATIGKVYGLKVRRLEVPWGEAFKVKDVESILKKNKKIKAVLTQVCETSTATEHPVEALSKALRKFPKCLLIVDAITAIGATPLPMDKWGLDVVVAGSQKAFMLPTGLSFIALSEKAWAANKKAKCPRYYFDLKAELEANKKDQSFFSTSVQMVRALQAMLEVFKERGLEFFIDRCGKLADATRTGAAELGLKTFSKSPANAVTALMIPKEVDGEKLRDHLEAKYNISLMGGQDHLKGKILRVGHLGDISNEDLIETLHWLGQSLMDLGAKNIDKAKIEKATDRARQALHG